jgi:hypothetical protein
LLPLQALSSAHHSLPRLNCVCGAIYPSALAGLSTVTQRDSAAIAWLTRTLDSLFAGMSTWASVVSTTSSAYNNLDKMSGSFETMNCDPFHADVRWNVDAALLSSHSLSQLQFSLGDEEHRAQFSVNCTANYSVATRMRLSLVFSRCRGMSILLTQPNGVAANLSLSVPSQCPLEGTLGAMAVSARAAHVDLNATVQVLIAGSTVFSTVSSNGSVLQTASIVESVFDIDAHAGCANTFSEQSQAFPVPNRALCLLPDFQTAIACDFHAPRTTLAGNCTSTYKPMCRFTRVRFCADSFFSNLLVKAMDLVRQSVFDQFRVLLSQLETPVPAAQILFGRSMTLFEMISLLERTVCPSPGGCSFSTLFDVVKLFTDFAMQTNKAQRAADLVGLSGACADVFVPLDDFQLDFTRSPRPTPEPLISSIGDNSNTTISSSSSSSNSHHHHQQQQHHHQQQQQQLDPLV